MIQVFNHNFIDDAVQKLNSSANADYPVANLYDITRRRKTWRSAGYWLIESGANTIIFNEGGADRTATITAQAYTTDATFLAAIASALNAAPGKQNTYSVARDVTTGKIKLTAVLAGSGTIFTIKWTSADDFGTLLGFDTSANDTGSLVYTADLLRIHTEEYFIFDLGVPMNPTGFIAVSDRNRPINISPTATVKIKGNPANSGWSSPAEEFTITVRDFLLGYVNHDGIAALDAGYRYWKISIIDSDNPDQYLELGAMFLGAHIEQERGCPAFPLEGRPVDNSVKDYSESGQRWSGKRPKTEVHSLGWEKLTKQDFADLKEFWEEVGTTFPFFVCLDPESVFSPDGIFWTRLVTFETEPTHRLISPNNWSYAWSLREEL